MILPIDKHWRIQGTAYCWQVERFKPSKAGKGTEKRPPWEPVSYHQTLEAAAESLAERLVRTADTTTLADALENCKNVARRLTLALSPQIGASAD